MRDLLCGLRAGSFVQTLAKIEKKRGGGGGLLEGEIPGNPHGRSVVNERSVKYGFTVSWPF